MNKNVLFNPRKAGLRLMVKGGAGDLTFGNILKFPGWGRESLAPVKVAPLSRGYFRELVSIPRRTARWEGLAYVLIGVSAVVAVALAFRNSHP